MPPTDSCELVSKMAALIRRSVLVPRSIFGLSRSLTSSCVLKSNSEVVTHTGQQFEDNDYRKARFEGRNKLVNTRFAIDLIAEDPVVVCTERVVYSDGGGPLGHPKVFINLDAPGVHSCGYSGRKFVMKKYYDEASMGPSITYDEYLKEVNNNRDLKKWPK